jgi:nicotinamide riboside kinase
VDILEIYRLQYKEEEEMVKKAHRLLFIDTEFIIGKVWCESAFGSVPVYFDTMIREVPYDLYLLMAPDLPWVYDPLRENPGKGEFYFNWYLDILKENNLPYGIVRGSGRERQNCAIEIIGEQTGILSDKIQ